MPPHTPIALPLRLPESDSDSDSDSESEVHLRCAVRCAQWTGSPPGVYAQGPLRLALAPTRSVVAAASDRMRWLLLREAVPRPARTAAAALGWTRVLVVLDCAWSRRTDTHALPTELRVLRALLARCRTPPHLSLAVLGGDQQPIATRSRVASVADIDALCAAAAALRCVGVASTRALAPLLANSPNSAFDVALLLSDGIFAGDSRCVGADASIPVVALCASQKRGIHSIQHF